MKKTLVVNLFGSPGTGKSTLMAELFAKLKCAKIDCEMVPEFAKELVWEARHDTLRDQLYILGKQHHRLFRLNGKVDVIVLDSPLLLNTVYNRLYNTPPNGIYTKQQIFNDSLEYTVVAATRLYNNLNIFLNRTKAYNPNGRQQTEEQSNELAVTILDTIKEHEIPFVQLDANSETADIILQLIRDELAEKS